MPRFRLTQSLLHMAAALLAPCMASASEALPVFSRTEPVRLRVDVTIANPGFEANGGWQDIHGAPFKPTEDARSGKRACRVDNLVKSEFIALNPGEELHFEAHIKVDNLCTVVAELAYFGADRQWLRRGSPVLARGDQYAWQSVTGRHELLDGEVRYVTLQFHGKGEVDDIRVWKMAAPPDTGDQAKARLNPALPDDDSRFARLANDAFDVRISRAAGMVAQLTSLQPAPKTIQPSGANSMQLYLKTRDGSKLDGDFNRVVEWTQADDGAIVCRLTSDNPELAALAEARIKYSLDETDFGVQAEITYLKDDPRPFQAGLRSVFLAEEWRRNIYMTFPILPQSAQNTVRLSFLYDASDDGVKNFSSGYPCAVLEGEDRFLLWGSYDLGRFTLLTPNDISWRLPSQQANPIRLKAGEKQVFASNYTVFPKADHELTQVMRHYVRRFYSSNPLTADVLAWRPADRYFTPGAFAWHHPGAVPLGYDGWRKTMRERHANNVWYSWWTNWDEVCPTEGEWITYDGRMLSANGLRDEIAYMKDMDLSVYLYFRQFLVEDGVHDDRPPYRRWLGRDQEGKRIPFIDHPFPRPDLLGGLDKIRWTMADFGDADYRAWYLGMVKRSIDFYRPSGVAWDMGFNNRYSAASPEIGIGHGTLWVQAMIYHWLRENHPDLRIATNETIANPTALFGDAILIEGAWRVVGKGELDYQVARAYDSALFSLQLTDDYIIQGVPATDLAPYRFMLARARGERVARADAGLGELVGHGFVPDGEWQWIRVPVTRPNCRMLSATVTATDEGNAWLEIGDLRLSPDGNENGAGARGVWNAETPAEDFVRFSKWSHSLPTTGHVEKTEAGVKFTADQPHGNSGMWLCITPVKDEWLQTNLRVLALGAVCSDAQIPALEELNIFSARVAAMRHVSDKKVIYDAPPGVFGTFWTRDRQTAAAIRNDADERRNVTLRISREALPDRGAALEEGNLNPRWIDANGRAKPAVGATLTSEGAYLLLKGELPPRGLLLVDTVDSQ